MNPILVTTQVGTGRTRVIKAKGQQPENFHSVLPPQKLSLGSPWVTGEAV